MRPLSRFPKALARPVIMAIWNLSPCIYLLWKYDKNSKFRLTVNIISDLKKIGATCLSKNICLSRDRMFETLLLLPSSPVLADLYSVWL